MKGAEIDVALFVSFLQGFNALPQGKKRGELVESFAKSLGISKATVYKKIRLSKVAAVVDVAKSRVPKKRKKQEQLDMEKKHMVILSALKRNTGENAKYWESTERAIAIAEAQGHWPAGMYSVNRADRLLKQFQLNRTGSKLKVAAFELTAKHAGHVFLVDATPLNHYYLRLDNKVDFQDTIAGDTHLDDWLRDHQLKKIWVYYAVDMHTGAYLPLAFAPDPVNPLSKNGGENAADWMSFLEFIFLPKIGLQPLIEGKRHPLHDCIMEGVPLILFADKGSSIGNNLGVKNICSRLGIDLKTHLPGNPSAKGKVESRIGASKRSVESSLRKHHVQTLDQLNYFLQSWAHYRNRQSGKYELWQKSASVTPIRRVSLQNIQDAKVSLLTRTVNGYGMISISGKEWVVPDENIRNVKITVYRAPAYDGAKERYIGETESGMRFELSDDLSIRTHDFDSPKAHKLTERDLLNREAKKIKSNINRAVSFEDVLPPEEKKVIIMPSKTEPVKTVSPFTPPSFGSEQEALEFIYRNSGMEPHEIPAKSLETITEYLRAAFRAYGYIKGETVSHFITSLIQYRKKRINQ